MTKGVFQIDAPRERLFGIIADFDRWNEWFPGCKQAKITQENDNSKQVDLTLASMKTGKLMENTPAESVKTL